MEDRNARQVWHVTYGVLLTAADEESNRLFKDDFFAMLDKYEDEYSATLVRHIGKHLSLLELPKVQ